MRAHDCPRLRSADLTLGTGGVRNHPRAPRCQVLNFYGMTHSEFSQPRTAWHPSGKYFYVTSGDRHIQAFEVATRSIVYTLEGHTSTVRDIFYDRARDCLWSCSFDQSVRQWVLDDNFVPVETSEDLGGSTPMATA